MRIEPDFDKSALIAALNRAYNLAVDQLTFIPYGEVAFSYVASGGKVGSAKPARYYLKVLDDTRLARLSAARLDFYLPAMVWLYDKAGFERLPRPIPTRDGALYATFDRKILVLFEFVGGEIPSEQILHTPTLWTQLAALVAHLHRSPAPTDGNLPPEIFDAPFESGLRDGLATLPALTPADGPGKCALRDLLLPHTPAILHRLDRLHALADRARTLNPPQVLCHTDIHAMNLLLNPAGELYVLDWEGVRLAPPEHDLFMFTKNADFTDFLREYRDRGGQTPLHAEVFGFYFYRRNLEDLADWVIRILYENTNETQNALDLTEIQCDCMAGWPYLDTHIARVRAHLLDANVGS